jgi:hypothetical protein
VNAIGKEYEKRMDALTPKERMARAVSMHQWSREIIARQIASNEGHCHPERMKWLVALREYGANSMTRDLIRKALDHVHS